MPKGIYKRKPFTEDHIRINRKVALMRHRRGDKFGFQKYNTINLGRKRPDMLGNKLGKIYGFKNNNKINLGRKHTDKWKEENSKRMTGEKHPNYIDGRSYEPYPSEWTASLRREILKRDNCICQKCTKLGKTVHHIDYDKKNCKCINLITLCISCNSKVNWRRKYWEKFFMSKIKLIYGKR